MNIEKVLELQAADLQYFKLEKEVKDSAEYKNMDMCRVKLAAAKEALKKADADAAEILLSYDRISDNIALAERNIAELVSAVGSIGDMKSSAGRELGECEFYLKNLEKASELLVNGEKEITRIKARINEIHANAARLISDIKEFGEKQKKAADDFERLKNLKKGDAVRLRGGIAELKAGLPEDFLEMYGRAKAEKPLPVFVKLLNKNQCSGCGMEIPADAQTKLKKSGDYSECPNCRRILYVQ
ncbi:MAG: C4-type zinc ribbon domain-containing protein [Clostridiales bacterium]|jgi:predicted  nucleic acid-binding Zn-ribbon protein|nr:C4-type zinc ribbon domain-containing protein [Clostridiales bacterium]